MRLLLQLRSGVRLAIILALALALLSLTGCACDTVGAPPGTAPTETAAPADGVTPDDRPGAGAIEAVIVHVIDGDTIRVRMASGAVEKVRYIGIDAPEVAHSESPGEYLGAEATAHNAKLLQSGPLRLKTDLDEWDDFGRLLAYVWAGDIFVNERMVLDGYARAHNYPPNLAQQDRLWEAHDKARAAGIGIWGQPDD
ncbi:MAG: thermonuclease family protein [Thermoleophilia bacterium]|nr:thermonuclease family protein [Thermoleophilia bacterium]